MLKYVLSFILSITFLSASALTPKYEKLKYPFTKEELSWIKDHRIINAGGITDWAPFDFINDDGIHTGIAKDYLDIIAKTSGFKVKYHTGKPWSELLISIKSGEIDILPAIYITPQRKHFINFTNSYFTLTEYFFTKHNEPIINDIKELNGKKLAVVKDNANNQWLKSTYPDIIIVEKASMSECLQAVISGEVTAFINTNAATTYYMDKNFITAIKLNNVVKQLKPNKLSMGIKKEYTLLTQIINKAIKNITKEQKLKISSKWMSEINKEKLSFTLKEKQWLDKKVPIKYVYDPDYAPFEWKNELNLHSGIISDILKIIKSKTGITFTAIQTNTWAQSVKLAEDKKADMYSAVLQTHNREQYMNFTTRDIYSVPAVFLTKKSDEYNYLDIKKDLIDKKIGIVDGNALGELIKSKYPSFTYITVESIQDGFEQIDKGNIDIFVSNKATAIYFIKIKAYKNTRIANKFDFTFGLKIAISKDMPKEVVSILNKAIDSITDKEIDDIYYKWTNVSPEKKTNWKLIGQISAVILFIFIFILFNNKKLKSMVKQQTADILRQKNELKVFNENLELKVKERTIDLGKAKKEVETIHKHVRDSIEYASLIQGALIPRKDAMKSFFKDDFVTWTPKDTVGGDIWLFSELRDKDECLLMYIDCTGHGVPGAFVTMIVKAIEREVILKIKADKYYDIDVSPAWIMSYFNKTMKILLRQETKDSLSNAGWDGGIIYYNKKEHILKFSGAETPLFYIDENKKFQTIKGTRYSVGYKKCIMDYTYKETIINVQKGMKFYCTTDGYLDQNGGDKNFPFGKTRFENIIKENHNKPMAELQTIFQMEIIKWQKEVINNDRNDDMTVIAFEI